MFAVLCYQNLVIDTIKIIVIYSLFDINKFLLSIYYMLGLTRVNILKEISSLTSWNLESRGRDKHKQGKK